LGVCAFLMLIALSSIVFIDDTPFEFKYLLFIPLDVFCLLMAWQCIAVYILGSRQIYLGEKSIVIGHDTFEWDSLTEWDLDTVRKFGLNGGSHQPAAVFVFGDEREVRIFYHLYSDGKLLKQTLEEVITILSQGEVEAQSKQDAICPRCLGKAYVYDDDIKRLHKQRVWEPGECLLCKGSGVVQQ
jgi:hypothetical protein